MAKSPRKKAWEWCSKYIRLRDAIKYCKRHSIDLGQFVRPEDIIGQCCTCGAVKSWIRMDAGHFKGRGIGGSSGAYFDERNIHLQCKQCNGFKQGAYPEYEEFITNTYGPFMVTELNRIHVTRIDMKALAMEAMKIFYKQKYEDLLFSTEELNYG